VPADLLTSNEARGRGRELFAEHCALCHGARADGQGERRNLSLPAADLTSRFWRASVTPREVYYVIREGKRGTPMPAWKILSEQQAWDLTAYVLRIAEEGP